MSQWPSRCTAEISFKRTMQATQLTDSPSCTSWDSYFCQRSSDHTRAQHSDMRASSFLPDTVLLQPATYGRGVPISLVAVCSEPGCGGYSSSPTFLLFSLFIGVKHSLTRKGYPYPILFLPLLFFMNIFRYKSLVHLVLSWHLLLSRPELTQNLSSSLLWYQVGIQEALHQRNFQLCTQVDSMQQCSLQHSLKQQKIGNNLNVQTQGKGLRYFCLMVYRIKRKNRVTGINMDESYQYNVK